MRCITHRSPVDVNRVASSTSRSCLVQHLVYVSESSPALPVPEFAKISRTSRHNNALNGLVGALLFDGDRYCQWLQGPLAEMTRTRDAIHRDSRHHRIDTLLWAEQSPVTGLQAWSSGFVEPAALDAFVAQCRAGQHDVVAAFRQLLRGADL